MTPDEFLELAKEPIKLLGSDLGLVLVQEGCGSVCMTLDDAFVLVERIIEAATAHAQAVKATLQ